MAVVRIVAGALLALVGSAAAACAQPSGAPLAAVAHADSVNAAAAYMPRHPSVYLSDNVRGLMRAEWDTVHATQPERAYCLLAVKRATPRGDSAWLVLRATRALPYRDDPESVAFSCNGMPVLHTHPPTTCERLPVVRLFWWPSCVVGGAMTNMGYPSSVDERAVAGTPFGLIQFGVDAYVIVYPPDTPPPVTRTTPATPKSKGRHRG